MTDWSTTRMFILGPKDELDRFKAQCIRSVPEEGCDEKTFDLNALVPMPDDLKLAMTAPTESHNHAETDVNPPWDWYNWRSKHWGTKWLPRLFSTEWTTDDIYDCIFDTPWRCPHPVIAALANAYPNLKGFTVSFIYSDDIGEIGQFADGVYNVTEIGSDFVCEDPVNCGCVCECDCIDEIKPEMKRMISRSHGCWEGIEEDVDGALAWAKDQGVVTRLVRSPAISQP